MWISFTTANVDDFKNTTLSSLQYKLCCAMSGALLSSGLPRSTHSPYRAWSSWWVLSRLTSPLSQPSSLQNKRRKQPALWYISVFESLWFIIQLPSNMFQLGSDFCWGLAAAVANRQLNIYILLSSGKQTPFWGSAVRAVKSLYLCACLHNFYNIFMVNECKFYFNHDPAQGLSGDKMHTHKVHRDKSNICSFDIKGFEIGVVTLWSEWPLLPAPANEGSVVCQQRTGLAATEQGSSSGP